MKIKRFVTDLVAGYPFSDQLLLRAGRLKTEIRVVARSTSPWEHIGQCWPTNLNIENLNTCNANCIFCAYQYQNKWRSTKGFMDSTLFKDIVRTHAEKGGKFLGISPMQGEPLLDRGLNEKLEFILYHGLSTSFFTNGILLDVVDVKALLETGVSIISLSTSALEKDLFHKIYRSNKYESLLNGIKQLLTVRNAMNADVTLNINFRSPLSYRKTVALPDFQHHIIPLLRSDEIHNVQVMNAFDDWAGQIQQSALLDGMRLRLSPRLKHRPCKWTFIPMVLWDGTVRACACRFKPRETAPCDELAVGDLRQQSLEDIWLGDKPKLLRRRFVQGDIPDVCQSCSMYDPC